MTTTDLKEKTTALKEKASGLVSGELTLTKLDFCLIGAVCLLAGICIGLLAAPFTHGISLWSNIGNNNGNNNGNDNGNYDNGNVNGDNNTWTEKEGD